MGTGRKDAHTRPPAFSAPYMLGRAAMARAVENAAFAVGFASAAVGGAFAYFGLRCLVPGIDPTAMLCVSAAGLAVGAASVLLAAFCGLSFSKSMAAAGDALGEFADELELRRERIEALRVEDAGSNAVPPAPGPDMFV